MNSKYPILPPKKIIKVMKLLGFHKISPKSSNAKFINQDIGKILIITMNYEIARGTLRSILEETDIEL